jgi:hypothetical protein
LSSHLISFYLAPSCTSDILVNTSSPTLLSYTPLLYTSSPIHLLSYTLLSYTLLSPTLLSYTPLTYTPLTHTPLTHTPLPSYHCYATSPHSDILVNTYEGWECYLGRNSITNATGMEQVRGCVWGARRAALFLLRANVASLCTSPHRLPLSRIRIASQVDDCSDSFLLVNV